jgi:hypothetical protein
MSFPSSSKPTPDGLVRYLMDVEIRGTTDRKELHMPSTDPEFELAEAKSLLDSLASLLAHKPPDDTLTRMAASMTKLIESLSTLGKEPLPKAIRDRQVKLFGEGTALSGEIRKRVLVLNEQYAAELKKA